MSKRAILHDFLFNLQSFLFNTGSEVTFICIVNVMHLLFSCPTYLFV